MYRFLLNTIFIAFFFILPAWLFLLLAIFVLFRVSFVWYEFIIFGLLFDIVSGPLMIGNILYAPVFTLFGVIVFFVALFIRKRMSFHV